MKKLILKKVIKLGLYFFSVLHISCSKDMLNNNIAISSLSNSNILDTSSTMSGLSDTSQYSHNSALSRKGFVELIDQIQKTDHTRKYVFDNIYETSKLSLANQTWPTDRTLIFKDLLIESLRFFLFQKDVEANLYLTDVKNKLLRLSGSFVKSDEYIFMTNTPSHGKDFDMLTAYSIIRPYIDIDSQTKIDNWLIKKAAFHNKEKIRNNNWDIIKYALDLHTNLIMNDQIKINANIKMIETYLQNQTRFDGVGVDLYDRDAFAYHIYNLRFISECFKLICINQQSNEKVNELFNKESNAFKSFKTVYGGTLIDQLELLDNALLGNVKHLEFLRTEWEQDMSKIGLFKGSGAATYMFDVLSYTAKDYVKNIEDKMQSNLNKPSIIRFINKFGATSFSDKRKEKEAGIIVYKIDRVNKYFVPTKEVFLSPGKYTAEDLKNVGLVYMALGEFKSNIGGFAIPSNKYNVTIYDKSDFTGNFKSVSSFDHFFIYFPNNKYVTSADKERISKWDKKTLSIVIDKIE